MNFPLRLCAGWIIMEFITRHCDSLRTRDISLKWCCWRQRVVLCLCLFGAHAGSLKQCADVIIRRLKEVCSASLSFTLWIPSFLFHSRHWDVPGLRWADLSLSRASGLFEIRQIPTKSVASCQSVTEEFLQIAALVVIFRGRSLVFTRETQTF